MTDTSGRQESGDSLPTAAACSMPQQREASTGNMPRGNPGTTPGHSSPTAATPDQDWEAMPPPAPRPPQRRNTGPFDDAELRALYGIHATAPSSELVPALREHLQDVDPSRLFALVPRHTPQQPKSLCGSSRRSSAAGHRSRTTLLTRGSCGATPTSWTREAYGSRTWVGHTRS